MYRNSPSRNQRSKGVKVKQILQICLLVAVSLWLLYQVKHSHDKKKEFDETDAKISLHGENSDDIIKLGRKDIRPLKEEPFDKNEKLDEILEEEEEIEENKNEEGGSADEKVLEKEEEETNETEQEKSDTEEDLVDDDKEREENETEEKDSEAEEGNTSPVEKESEQEVVDKDTHEARDENYKADDASSEVTHETQTLAHENASGQESKGNNSMEINKGENKADLNVTTIETKENALFSNKTEARESENLLQMSKNSTGVAIENREQKLTQIELESNPSLNNSTLEVDNAHVESNSTVLPEIKDAEANPEDFHNSSNNTANTEEFSNSSNKTESFASEVERNGTLNGDKSESHDGKDEEILESEMNENPEEVQRDSTDISDSSDTLEMKDVRTDLDTLPEIQTEGANSEDFAAE